MMDIFTYLFMGTFGLLCLAVVFSLMVASSCEICGGIGHSTISHEADDIRKQEEEL